MVAIGIDLGRLAFEEFVIDDKRVQDQRSSNAQAIANTTAQVLTPKKLKSSSRNLTLFRLKKIISEQLINIIIRFQI